MIHSSNNKGNHAKRLYTRQMMKEMLQNADTLIKRPEMLQNADTLTKDDEGNGETNKGNVENANTLITNIGFSIEFRYPCGQRILI